MVPAVDAMMGMPGSHLCWESNVIVAVRPASGKGYYGLDCVLILLAFMALARLSSIESLC